MVNSELSSHTNDPGGRTLNSDKNCESGADHTAGNWTSGKQEGGLTSVTNSELTDKSKDYSGIPVKTKDMISGKPWADAPSDARDDQSESDQDVNVTDDENVDGEDVGKERQTLNNWESTDAALSPSGDDHQEKDETKPQHRDLIPSLEEKLEVDKSPGKFGISANKTVLSPGQGIESPLPYKEKLLQGELDRSDNGPSRTFPREEVFGGFPAHFFHPQQQPMFLSPDERILMNRNRMPLSVLQLHQHHQQYQHHQHQQQQEQQQHAGYLDMLYRRHIENMYGTLQGRTRLGISPPLGADKVEVPQARGGIPGLSWETERQHGLHRDPESNSGESATSTHSIPSDNSLRHASTFDNPIQPHTHDSLPRDSGNSLHSPSSRKRQLKSPEQSADPDNSKCQKRCSSDPGSRDVSPSRPPSTQPLAASSRSNPSPGPASHAQHRPPPPPAAAPTAYSLQQSCHSTPVSRPKSSSPPPPSSYSIPHRPWSPAPNPAPAQVDRHTPHRDQSVDVTGTWYDISMATGDAAGDDDDDVTSGDRRGGSPGLNFSPSSSPDRLKQGEN
ncbi:hypothetical protein EGW08_018196 [Elysia chlorotica]|uniref:Uncharacterized protein n=1 Tax=Elysia chlorotica TaxID=188477 RepID=A0A3S0Z9X0_ELYCH|nr:hypothetical protein EGW08_018196 [Elysia chlorotica]